MGLARIGTVDGMGVDRVDIANGSMSAGILTYGATLQYLRVPARDGTTVDVVLGYDTLDEYISRPGRMGATMGRFTNRIANARFTLKGVEYRLTANRGAHHIHGGNRGFDKRLWTVMEYGDDYVRLGIRSPDGEEGYPGNLCVEVVYRLTGDSLKIEYLAQSDMDTILNLTNHSYFNLNGKGTVDDHVVTINADGYTPTDSEGIPTGEIADVQGTRYNLARPKAMRDVFRIGGIDNNYILRDKSYAAQVRSESSGIQMTVYTDYPAIQIYTGDNLRTDLVGKNGQPIPKHGGMCFETQFCPDTPNHLNFPQCILYKHRKQMHYTEFRFS